MTGNNHLFKTTKKKPTYLKECWYEPFIEMCMDAAEETIPFIRLLVAMLGAGISSALIYFFSNMRDFHDFMVNLFIEKGMI